MRVSTSNIHNLYRQQTKTANANSFTDLFANAALTKPTGTGKASGGINVVGTPISKELDYLPFRLLARKVDTTRQLNTNSKGDAALTGEQIESLKEKYDFNNLTMQDQYDLYCDLTDMGVLSATDVENIGISHISLKGDGGFHTAAESPITSGEEAYGSLSAWMAAVVGQEQAGYDYMLELGEELKKNGHQYTEFTHRGYKEFQNSIEAIDKIMAAHKKAARVLESLALQNLFDGRGSLDNTEGV